MSDTRHYDIGTILQEMQADYWRSLELVEEEGAAGQDYLVVRSGGRSFGLAAPLCKEILKVPQLVRVPRLPAHIPGIFNLRGEIVAVTDLSALLEGESAQFQASGRLVVVAHGPMKTALLVECVDGLRRIAEDQVEALADGVAARWREVFEGKVQDEPAAVMLLDLERLLAHPDLLVDQQGKGN